MPGLYHAIISGMQPLEPGEVQVHYALYGELDDVAALAALGPALGPDELARLERMRRPEAWSKAIGLGLSADFREAFTDQSWWFDQWIVEDRYVIAAVASETSPTRFRLICNDLAGRIPYPR